MTNTLTLPSGAAPSNLSIPQGAKAVFVDGDMYNICERIKEVSESLHIILMEKDDKYAFSVVEHCDDGVVRLVKKYKELDGRVIEDMQRILALPMEGRIADLEKECKKFEDDAKEAELDKLYEEMGAPMRRQMIHDGFIEPSGYIPPTSAMVKGKGSKSRSTRTFKQLAEGT